MRVRTTWLTTPPSLQGALDTGPTATGSLDTVTLRDDDTVRKRSCTGGELAGQRRDRLGGRESGTERQAQCAAHGLRECPCDPASGCLGREWPTVIALLLKWVPGLGGTGRGWGPGLQFQLQTGGFLPKSVARQLSGRPAEEVMRPSAAESLLMRFFFFQN